MLWLLLLLRLLRCFWITSKRGGGCVTDFGSAIRNSQLLPLLPLWLLIAIERILVGAACDIVVIDLIRLRDTSALAALPGQQLIEQSIHKGITAQTRQLSTTNENILVT